MELIFKTTNNTTTKPLNQNNMTPKEKAQELIDKYRIILMQSDTYAGEEILCTTIAKQCALIAVDEILKYLTTSLDVQTSLSAVNYWEEVKQEIEKL